MSITELNVRNTWAITPDAVTWTVMQHDTEWPVPVELSAWVVSSNDTEWFVPVEMSDWTVRREIDPSSE